MSGKILISMLAAVGVVMVFTVFAVTSTQAAEDSPRPNQAQCFENSAALNEASYKESPAGLPKEGEFPVRSAQKLVAALLQEASETEPTRNAAELVEKVVEAPSSAVNISEIEVITLTNLSGSRATDPPETLTNISSRSASAPRVSAEAPMALVQAVPIKLEGLPLLRMAATDKPEEGEETGPSEEAESAEQPASPEPEAPAPPPPREAKPEMKPVTRKAKPLPVPEKDSSLASAKAESISPASQYKGDPLKKPVTIEFREMDLANVVALLAQQADINVIAGTEITGTVTASLKNIPLMEAMEVVLGMNALGIIKEDSIYRIVPIEEAIAAKRMTKLVVLEKANADEVKGTLDAIILGYPDSQAISVAANPTTNVVVLAGPSERVQELEQIARQLDIAEPVTPTITRAIKLNYAEPDGIRPVIEGMLTKEIGMVEEDARGRHIVVTDTPVVVAQIEELVTELDMPVKQVAIDAMIVDAVMRDASQTGVDWLLQRIPSRNSRGEVIGNLQELALDATMGNIGADVLDAGILSVGTLSSDWDFRADIAAEVQSRNAEILANPVVVTVENMPAEISIVQEFPYQELTQTTQGPPVATTEFKPIGVELQVTPRVTHNNDIIVEILTKQSSISGLTETGVPIEDKREASTTLLTGNGRTIFIGGLRNVSDRLDVNKLPVLGDIPIARFLFSQNDVEKINTELLVFMTCNVVEKELPELSPEQRARHDKLDTVPQVPDSQRSLFRTMTHPEEIRDPAWKWRRKK